MLEIIGNKAKEHKKTVCMGRTHRVHAEPTTFGLKLATMCSEMKRNIERFEHAAKGVEAGKISGAVGTFANIPPFVEEYVCEKLGIRPQEISTQGFSPRDLHAEYMATIALIATSIERFATEIRGLQKSGNPRSGRILRERPKRFFRDAAQAQPDRFRKYGWPCPRHPRLHGHCLRECRLMALNGDISHSSAERIILPDATTLLNYQLNRLGTSSRT